MESKTTGYLREVTQTIAECTRLRRVMNECARDYVALAAAEREYKRAQARLAALAPESLKRQLASAKGKLQVARVELDRVRHQLRTQGRGQRATMASVIKKNERLATNVVNLENSLKATREELERVRLHRDEYRLRLDDCQRAVLRATHGKPR